MALLLMCPNCHHVAADNYDAADEDEGTYYRPGDPCPECEPTPPRAPHRPPRREIAQCPRCELAAIPAVAGSRCPICPTPQIMFLTLEPIKV